jgi:hypothetical protein
MHKKSERSNPPPKTARSHRAHTELARRLNCRVEDILGKPILDFLPAEV